jgi:hypothetical protein
MMEAKIQALVDRGLLRPKEEVEWEALTGEAFPTEDEKELVVFGSFFERGFNIPAGDFFRGLLFYYKLELVHLVPNVGGRLSYQSSYGFASGQIPRRSQETLLPSSGEPKVSNPWNNVQRKDSI